MLAAARWISPDLPVERKLIAAGAGITIPIRAARLSIRWAPLSDVTLARSSSFRLCSAVPRSSELPMLALSFRTSTCIATIPANSTPRSGIQARPRMIRSSRRWSGRPRTTAAHRVPSEIPSVAARGGAGRVRGRTPGRWGRTSGSPAATAPPCGPETRRGARGAGWRRTSARCPADRGAGAAAAAVAVAEGRLGAAGGFFLVPRPAGVSAVGVMSG
jgi:hypothetical protein